MKTKNIILLSALLIAIATGVYFYFFKTDEKTFLWKTYRVERGDIKILVTATGSINALTTVQVGTQVSGTISKLFADFNSIVYQGQIIALLNTTFLAPTRDDAQASVEKANVLLNQMKSELDRAKKLFDSNTVAKSDYDLAVTNYESAQSTLKSAQAQLTRAKINLQYATIQAPISGVVISRNVDVGQTVVSSFNAPTLFTIANDLTKMQVYANIDEADIGQIKAGQNATFSVDAYPDELFSGIIKQVRLQPNVIQNVVNYTVIIDIANPDLKLLPGLTANIKVKVDEHKNVLKVPINALRFNPPTEYIDTISIIPDSIKKKLKTNQTMNLVPGKFAFLWVKKGGAIIPCKVKLGLMDSGFAEVTGELKEQEEVVTGMMKEDNNASTKNPFMPNMARPRRM